MIPKQLKTHFHTADSVVQEFAALMNATFQYYAETRTLFFDRLPTHLHESQLASVVNAEIKERLFNQTFCEGIQEALKALRRAIIRLEDLRRLHPDLPHFIHDLSGLIGLAERAEALYQRHWEYYRYQAGLSEEEIVRFLMEIDQIGNAWGALQQNQAAVSTLVEALSGRPRPENGGSVRITYQQEGPHHFAVTTLKTLMNFLESGYRFLCQISGIDPAVEPLSLLQVEIAEPVEIHLAVPLTLEEPFRRFFQYLFLKDMLKRETLLKFVFEAIEKEYGKGKTLPAPAMNGLQRELSAQLKALPHEGRFTISDRTFPDDAISVLQEFTGALEEQKIDFESLVRAGEKGGKPAKPRPASGPRSGPTGSGQTGQEPPAAAESGSSVSPAPQRTREKEHIRLLTENDLAR